LAKEHGADAANRTNGGRTLLDEASSGGELGLVWFLVEKHGAGVATRDEYR